jgi:hypothetical protein
MMTHAEALACDPKAGALPGQSCPGELLKLGEYPDRHLDPRGAGMVETLVKTYRCPECDHNLSIDADGHVRNCYLSRKCGGGESPIR